MSKPAKSAADDVTDLFAEARLESEAKKFKKLLPVKKAEQKLKEADVERILQNFLAQHWWPNFFQETAKFLHPDSI